MYPTLDRFVEAFAERHLFPAVLTDRLSRWYYKRGFETSRSRDDPRRGAILQRLSKRYWKRGNLTKAIGCAVSSKWYGRRSETAVLQKIRRQYEMAVKLGSKDYWAHYSLAAIYIQLGLSEQDFIEIKPTKEAEPNFRVIYYGLKGGDLLREGKIEEGIKLLKRRLEFNPHDVHTLNSLASAYEDKDDINDAICYYKKLIAGKEREEIPFHFGIARVYDKLAELYTKKGMFKEAAEARKKSFELNPYPEISNEVHNRLDVIAGINSTELMRQLFHADVKGLCSLPRAKLLAFVRGDYEAQLEKQIPDLVKKYGARNEEEVRDAISFLYNYLRVFSIMVLGEEKEKIAIPYLEHILMSDEPRFPIHYIIPVTDGTWGGHADCCVSAKEAAVKALSDIGTESTIDMLVEAFETPRLRRDADIRRLIIECLADTKRELVSPLLAMALENPPDFDNLEEADYYKRHLVYMLVEYSDVQTLRRMRYRLKEVPGVNYGLMGEIISRQFWSIFS